MYLDKVFDDNNKIYLIYIRHKAQKQTYWEHIYNMFSACCKYWFKCDRSVSLVYQGR